MGCLKTRVACGQVRSWLTALREFQAPGVEKPAARGSGQGMSAGYEIIRLPEIGTGRVLGAPAA